jgi:hypothetical protein
LYYSIKQTIRMSSSNNQSAETYIANGLTFNISDLDITAPKLNKSGGKSANLLYKPTKKSLYVNMQVPMLTWGANVFRDPQSGKETYDLALQFPRKDYSSPETDTLLAKFQALETLIKTEAVKNCMAWFNKKMTPELVDAAWTPMLKYSKDKETGEPDMTKSPTLKIKLPQYDGKFNCEIYDPNGNMMYPNDKSTDTPMDLIPKGVNIVAIIQCGGLWFANKAFGCTWRLFQVVVQPKPSMKGRCLIAVTPAAKSALSGSASSGSNDEGDEVGVTIADDSDDEQEAEPIAIVTKPVVVAAAPVVKKVIKQAEVVVPVVVAPVAVVEEAVTEEAVAVVEEPVAVAAPVVAAAAKPAVKKVVRKKE